MADDWIMKPLPILVILFSICLEATSALYYRSSRYTRYTTYRRTSFYSGSLSSTWIIVIGVGCFVALVAGVIFCFCMSHKQQTKRRRVTSVGVPATTRRPIIGYSNVRGRGRGQSNPGRGPSTIGNPGSYQLAPIDTTGYGFETYPKENPTFIPPPAYQNLSPIDPQPVGDIPPPVYSNAETFPSNSQYTQQDPSQPPPSYTSSTNLR